MAFRCCGKGGSGNPNPNKKGTQDKLSQLPDRPSKVVDDNIEKATQDRMRQLADESDKHPILTDIKKMFKTFDEDNNGVITKEETVAAFKKLKIPVLPDEVMKIFVSYDTNGDNELSYKEFNHMMKDLLKTKEFPVADMFKYFDCDDDGFITVEEFMISMQCLGINMTEQKAREMMKSYFVPGEEKIDFENFLSLMKKIMK